MTNSQIVVTIQEENCIVTLSKKGLINDYICHILVKVNVLCVCQNASNHQILVLVLVLY